MVPTQHPRRRGQGSPKDYVKQLTPMLNDQRLKAWSAHQDEEDLLLTSPAGNMLPADNTKATAFGVYNNDDATSKMSYYMNATVALKATVCPAKTPTYTVSTTVTNILKPSLNNSGPFRWFLYESLRDNKAVVASRLSRNAAKAPGTRTRKKTAAGTSRKKPAPRTPKPAADIAPDRAAIGSNPDRRFVSASSRNLTARKP